MARSPDRPKSTPSLGNDRVSADQRFDSYIALHTNLDNLIWNNQATLHGITVLGAGAIGFVLEKFRPQVGELSRSGALILILLLMAGLYGITVFTLFRMRRWHQELERELARLEPPGYFRTRTSASRLASAQWWTGVLYVGLASLCLIAAVRETLVGL